MGKLKEFLTWFFVILGIALAIVGLVWGTDIYDWAHGYTGVRVSPSEIVYNCNGMGIIKTITITNYEDVSVNNYVLTFSYPLNNRVSIEINDFNRINRDVITSLELSVVNSTKNIKTFHITSLKPRDSEQFEVSIISSICAGSVVIGVDNPQDKSYEITDRIFS